MENICASRRFATGTSPLLSANQDPLTSLIRTEIIELIALKTINRARRSATDPQSVNAIIKQRLEMAGLDSGEFSAHGLRWGLLTETANCGIPLPEAMEQSRHRSVQQASSYYNNATRHSGRATRML